MSKIRVNLDELQNFAIEIGKAANSCDQALGNINMDLYSLLANTPGVASRQIHELEGIFRNNLKKYKNRLDDSQRLIRMTVAKMNETEMLLVRKAAELGRDQSGYYENLQMFKGINGSPSGESAIAGEFISAEDLSCKRPNSTELNEDTAWYDVVGNAILGIIDGAAKAIVDIFKGLWDLIVALTTDPLGFFKGIGNAVLHPVDTFNYMWGAVETAWDRDVINGDARSRGEFFSYAVVSIVGLKGLDKVGKVGKLNKVGKGGAKVDGNTSLSSAAKVLTSNSLVPIPFNVLQTAKLKELVKNNVVSAFSKGSQWTKDFFKNDLVQKALKQGVVAIGNAKTLSKIRYVVNPAAFNSFFKNTFNDVIKSPLAKTKIAIDQQLRKVVEGIGKVEVPTRIKVKLLDAFYGMKIPVVDLGITTMKDVVQKFSGSSKKDSSVITEGTDEVGNGYLKNIDEFISGNKEFNEVLDDYSVAYAEKINSNVPWKWRNIPGGDELTQKQLKLIRERAKELEKIPDVPMKPGTKYPDFEKANLIININGEPVIKQLPIEYWKKSDPDQFGCLDSQLPGGKRPLGTTWHHSEIDGRMELVPFGIHNSVYHSGGRAPGGWAYGKR